MKKQGVVHPKFWFRHWRVRRALVGYPLYDVPYKTQEADLTETQVRENFDYFLRVRQERLAFFFDWLRRKFGVAASLTPEGVLAIERWVRDFGGGAIESTACDLRIFATYTPAWTDSRAGYNVMIDLGIFIGEYLIWRRPELYWEIYRGHEIEPVSFRSPTYLKPIIDGMPRLWKDDTFRTGYGAIAGACQKSLIGSDGFRDRSNSFVFHIKQSLYFSRLPDDVVVLGESKNEPL
ncbi:hypothetical protein G3T14_11640 [Methylobacterium sp. BTF04]|uniref:hypothetical protein n=1 Tax=Methylobacterium sp. BTF04 TaxID=2708300 RepID=UPI0013D2AC91|nr:hypothetical protein [Methylobacterium sp. BTF04]NEU12784.1 hypothetical protein [Methylobacterium sp. BTF04]